MPLWRRRSVLIGGVALVLVAAVAAVLLRGPTAEPVVAQNRPTQSASPAASPAPEPALTPEQQARADLDELVRAYYAAENAVFLDPMSDPSAALDPYLRNPASAARIADILRFRNAGHVFDERSAEVHSVVVTELELGASPATATIEVCKSLEGKGTDGLSGQPERVADRGMIIWNAKSSLGGDWRLFEYAGIPGEEGRC